MTRKKTDSPEDPSGDAENTPNARSKRWHTYTQDTLPPLSSIPAEGRPHAQTLPHSGLFAATLEFTARGLGKRQTVWGWLRLTPHTDADKTDSDTDSTPEYEITFSKHTGEEGAVEWVHPGEFLESLGSEGAWKPKTKVQGFGVDGEGGLFTTHVLAPGVQLPQPVSDVVKALNIQLTRKARRPAPAKHAESTPTNQPAMAPVVHSAPVPTFRFGPLVIPPPGFNSFAVQQTRGRGTHTHAGTAVDVHPQQRRGRQWSKLTGVEPTPVQLPARRRHRTLDKSKDGTDGTQARKRHKSEEDHENEATKAPFHPSSAPPNRGRENENEENRNGFTETGTDLNEDGMQQVDAEGVVGAEVLEVGQWKDNNEGDESEVDTLEGHGLNLQRREREVKEGEGVMDTGEIVDYENKEGGAYEMNGGQQQVMGGLLQENEAWEGWQAGRMAGEGGGGEGREPAITGGTRGEMSYWKIQKMQLNRIMDFADFTDREWKKTKDELALWKAGHAEMREQLIVVAQEKEGVEGQLKERDGQIVTLIGEIEGLRAEKESWEEKERVLTEQATREREQFRAEKQSWEEKQRVLTEQASREREQFRAELEKMKKEKEELEGKNRDLAEKNTELEGTVKKVREFYQNLGWS